MALLALVIIKQTMIKMRRFRILFIGLLLVIAATGCSDKKFTRVKWSNSDGLSYPLRDDILNDLMANHQLKGLTYRQVIDSLGAPQMRDRFTLAYQVVDNSFQYARKKPVHKKNLLLYFSRDSVVTRFEVYEHTDKK